MQRDELAVLIGGEAGQGLVTAGQLLTKAFIRAGYDVCVTQSYQSRIRGGHNTYEIRVATRDVAAPADAIDLLVALDAATVAIDRHALRPAGIIVAGEGVPAEDAVFPVPFSSFGPARYATVAAAGVAAFLVGLKPDILAGVVAEAFQRKPEEAAANGAALAAAYEWAAVHLAAHTRPLNVPSPRPARIMLNGNAAAALGAASAGAKFCAFYPMTPATGIPLTLAAHAREFRIAVEQAEDEIAAVNMAIGASYAGAPSLVATSGGGFALMVEGLSLAAMTETPLVVVVGQRPGPATGLPTRTEQADLDFVLYAGHGEFPRAVLAPGTVEDCFHLARRAFELAARYQGPIFVLTDQWLADSERAVVPFDVETALPLAAYLPPGSNSRPYRRYEPAEDGISPRRLPGLGDELVVADSDEHTADGHLTEDLEVRKEMVRKRLRKWKGLRAAIIPPAYYGPEDGQNILVCWGSPLGAVREAAASLTAAGTSTAVLHFSQVYPLDPGSFLPRLSAAARVIAVEGNAGGQFAGLLRREAGFHIERLVSRYDGLPMTPEYVRAGVARIIAEEGK